MEVRMNVFMITILMIQLTHESDSKSIVSDDEQAETPENVTRNVQTVNLDVNKNDGGPQCFRFLFNFSKNWKPLKMA